ncbi:MAG: hypothetical protein H8D31_02445 [Nitrosopumilus sp.]|nr:hypothetical protein [Nitrosopumilus sp.]
MVLSRNSMQHHYFESLLKTPGDCILLTKGGELFGIVTAWDIRNPKLESK